MCIRDRPYFVMVDTYPRGTVSGEDIRRSVIELGSRADSVAVSYTHLRAHETVLDLVCRLLLEKKKSQTVNDNVCSQ